MSWPKKEIIIGCQSFGQPLLTRYHLLSTRWFKLYYHIFHRSDYDRACHDHPWPFYSLILWGGYTEVRPTAGAREALAEGQQVADLEKTLERVPYYPGNVLFRPSHWAHRIELEPGKKSYSLCLILPKEREWGFFLKEGWKHWKEFVSSADCG